MPVQVVFTVAATGRTDRRRCLTIPWRWGHGARSSNLSVVHFSSAIPHHCSWCGTVHVSPSCGLMLSVTRFGRAGHLVGGSLGNDVTDSKRRMLRKASAYQGVLGILPCLCERTMSVLIENRDFRSLIRLYHSEKTCFCLQRCRRTAARSFPSRGSHRARSDGRRAWPCPW